MSEDDLYELKDEPWMLKRGGSEMSDPNYDERVKWLSRVEELINEYLDGYEMRGEDVNGCDACYEPTEGERFLIKDAIHGLLDDEEFMKALLTWRELCEIARAQIDEEEGK